MKVIAILLIFILLPFPWYVEDFSLKQDAFHNSSIETWYFEGISENYSFVLMITYFSGNVMVGCYIYKDSLLEKYGRKIFHKFELSHSHPMLKAGESKIMDGFVKNDTLIYHIKFFDGENGLNITMRNITKGWVMHDGTMWLAVPDMDMEGSIYTDGIIHHISGRGYHDHNIFRVYSPLISRGYEDGKVMLNGTSFVWANILYPIPDKFIVLSYNSTYHVLHNVSIHAKNYSFFRWHFIPTCFEVYGWNGNSEIKARFSSISIHYIHLPFINYWRYHVIAEGYVRTGNKNQSFSNHEIMEYMRY